MRNSSVHMRSSWYFDFFSIFAIMLLHVASEGGNFGAGCDVNNAENSKCCTYLVSAPLAVSLRNLLQVRESSNGDAESNFQEHLDDLGAICASRGYYELPEISGSGRP